MDLELVDSNPEPGEGKIVSIIIADDHPLIRHALRDILTEQEDFRVLAEARDGEEAVKLVNELHPDVVIMDITMPKINGPEATRRIKANCPDTGVLMLTVHSDIGYVLTALEAGAEGYLTKSAIGNEVIHAIRGLVAGDAVFSKEISREIVKRVAVLKGGQLAIGTADKLTSREAQVLRLAAMGLRNREIASILNVSSRTIKAYLVEIFSKLGVKSRTGAVIVGLKAGLLTLDEIDEVEQT